MVRCNKTILQTSKRSRRMSRKYQPSSETAGIILPPTIYVDTTTKKEIRIELPTNKKSCNITGFMWQTKGYVANVRFSRCLKRRYHEPIQDLMEGDLKSKIELRPGENARIILNIKRDSTFLMEHGIMDYSLLLCVRRLGPNLVFEIVPLKFNQTTIKHITLERRYITSIRKTRLEQNLKLKVFNPDISALSSIIWELLTS